MKRSLIAFLWFVGFYFGGHFLLGFSIGFQGGLKGQSNEEVSQTVEAATEKLGNMIFLVSVAAAVAGTATQKLPGTRE